MTNSPQEPTFALRVADALVTMAAADEQDTRRSAEFHTTTAGPIAYMDRVVEDVESGFHDDFVDTTWPPCPAARAMAGRPIRYTHREESA